MEIYIDGSCLGNPGPGGWASLITHQDGYEVTLRGGAVWTTNNRMELEAFLATLDYLLSIEVEGDVFVFSDSEYVINGYNKWMPGWLRRNFKGVANIDLWRRLERMGKLPFKVHLSWVQAHSGIVGNERVDIMAKRSAMRFRNL